MNTSQTLEKQPFTIVQRSELFLTFSKYVWYLPFFLESGNFECASLILNHAKKEKELNPFELRDFDGECPLHDAVMGFRMKVFSEENLLKTVSLFLEYRECDVNVLDYSDSTPLHRLSFNPCHSVALKIAKMLLEKGADPTKADIYGLNALHATYQAERELAGQHRENALILRKTYTEHISNQKGGDQFLRDFDPKKKRDPEVRDIFEARSGPHNTLSSEAKNYVLKGKCSLEGIAQYLLEISKIRKPKVVFATGAGISVSANIPVMFSLKTNFPI